MAEMRSLAALLFALFLSAALLVAAAGASSPRENVTARGTPVDEISTSVSPFCADLAQAAPDTGLIQELPTGSDRSQIAPGDTGLAPGPAPAQAYELPRALTPDEFLDGIEKIDMR